MGASMPTLLPLGRRLCVGRSATRPASNTPSHASNGARCQPVPPAGGMVDGPPRTSRRRRSHGGDCQPSVWPRSRPRCRDRPSSSGSLCPSRAGASLGWRCRALDHGCAGACPGRRRAAADAKESGGQPREALSKSCGNESGYTRRAAAAESSRAPQSRSAAEGAPRAESLSKALSEPSLVPRCKPAAVAAPASRAEPAARRLSPRFSAMRASASQPRGPVVRQRGRDVNRVVRIRRRRFRLLRGRVLCSVGYRRRGLARRSDSRHRDPDCGDNRRAVRLSGFSVRPAPYCCRHGRSWRRIRFPSRS